MANTPRKRTAKKVAAAPNGAKRSYITAGHRADIALIGNTLYELAEEEGFCSLYFDKLNELNEKLTVKFDKPIRPVTVLVDLELQMEGVSTEGSGYNILLLGSENARLTSLVKDAVTRIPGVTDVDVDVDVRDVGY